MAQKAIATFHTGVSEDALLKNDSLKELRTKLLKEAAGFYADLEKLLAGKTDAKSRKLLAVGYSQLGELTEKIGDQKEALAVHRQALALRRELAAAPGADVETRLDVARSLMRVGRLLAPRGTPAGRWRPTRRHGRWPRHWRRRRRRTRSAGPGPEPPRHRRRAGADGQAGRGAGGVPEGAAIRQKLADANPAVTAFQSDLARSHPQHRHRAAGRRRGSRPRRWRRTNRRGRSGRSWPTPTPPSPSSRANLARSHNRHRQFC